MVITNFSVKYPETRTLTVCQTAIGKVLVPAIDIIHN